MIRNVLGLAFGAALGASLGCSSGGTPAITAGSGAGSGTGGGSAGGGGIGIGGSGETFTLTWGPVTVPATTENTQCVIKRLGNPSPMHVGRIRNELGSFSHHMVVYTTTDTVEAPTPFDCSPFRDTLDPSKGSPIMVSQKADDVLVLPDGVGFAFEANQMIRLELHYINTSASVADVEARATFASIPESLFQYEAGFLFVGNPDITIPAMSTATVGPTWFPMPSEFSAASFFAITGHTHQWGTNVTVATAPGQAGSDVPVYDVTGWQWAEPETVMHAPPFQIPASGGFRFTCQYDNLSSQTVTFGESADQEMCFFWAYYYPSLGSKVCFHTDQLTIPVDACCPGNPLCAQLAQFF